MKMLSVKNLLRRIQDLENNMLDMEAKMVLFVKHYTVLINIYTVFVNKSRIQFRAMQTSPVVTLFVVCRD